jgi:glycosyltransferase involved in cell wall biosynthesis
VVIPAYNEEKLILNTLNSVPKYVDKIYAVDDCSTDTTKAIIQKYDDARLVPIFHEVNKGVGAAIISGYKSRLKMVLTSLL